MPKFSRQTSLLLLVGIAAGFLSGLFGVGGGILVVPGLMIFAKLDQRMAHGTSLAAVLPISAASLVSYWAHDHVDWSVALFLSLGAIVGAVIGTALLARVSKRALSLTFAGILFVAGVRLFFSINGDGRATITVVTALALVLIGVFTGALAGLLGVGGGIVMVPVMAVLFGIPSVVAKGTSLAVIIPTAIMGTSRNRKNSNVDLPAAAIVGVTGIIFAIAGAWVSARMSETLSNTMFAFLLLGVAVRMIMQSRKSGTQPDAATAIAE